MRQHMIGVDWYRREREHIWGLGDFHQSLRIMKDLSLWSIGIRYYYEVWVTLNSIGCASLRINRLGNIVWINSVHIAARNFAQIAVRRIKDEISWYWMMKGRWRINCNLLLRHVTSIFPNKECTSISAFKVKPVTIEWSVWDAPAEIAETMT